MHIQQLNPTIRIQVKDKGPAEAIALFDYGPEEDIMWLVFLEKDGQSIFVYGSDIKKCT